MSRLYNLTVFDNLQGLSNDTAAFCQWDARLWQQWNSPRNSTPRSVEIRHGWCRISQKLYSCWCRISQMLFYNLLFTGCDKRARRSSILKLLTSVDIGLHQSKQNIQVTWDQTIELPVSVVTASISKMVCDWLFTKIMVQSASFKTWRWLNLYLRESYHHWGPSTELHNHPRGSGPIWSLFYAQLALT